MAPDTGVRTGSHRKRKACLSCFSISVDIWLAGTLIRPSSICCPFYFQGVTGPSYLLGSTELGENAFESSAKTAFI